MFSLRFDLRAPSTGAPAADLYQAALEMGAWAESRGAVYAMFCEHHSASDGYLPSPTVMAGALAARTTNLPIMVAVVLLPLYDPIRLAEDMCVVDILSRGRVSYVAAIGYRPVEYEMMGVDYARRGAIADEKLELLLKAKTGEPFVHEGRRIHVTPPPFTPGGPSVAWGGGSVPAARRAGRNGLAFFGQGGDADKILATYTEAALANGHEPGMCIVPPVDSPNTVFVAEDLDEAWHELGPYLMHDVRSYAEWNEGRDDVASISFVDSAEALRAENRSHRILTVDEAVAMVRAGAPLGLHPLIGGLPPDLAWKYLHTVVDRVMPALAG
ncbi:MAG: LLM class flavin-dependent oxidoreductase [Acidimicrobiales bacterium]|jgi:alkanesulfonate monooxygenase SsuD/methylene tetrahydromethanopterin reductase-like flavin-dependent oxidoreductase (luciferase family)|nr:LLM class flavin-dependent oxidoreductase [Acidimicrobiales bacterium]